MQNETKKCQIANYQSNLDEAKKKNTRYQDEVNRQEDKVRDLSIELTSLTSQVDKLQHNVSMTSGVN